MLSSVEYNYESERTELSHSTHLHDSTADTLVFGCERCVDDSIAGLELSVVHDANPPRA